MISGATRDTAARVGGGLAALGIAAVLVLFGPRLADFPAELGAIGPWFRDAPELALANCLGLIAWVCLLWLCAGVILGSLAALPGAAGRLFAALANRVLPRAVRRIVEVGLGVTLVAASVSPLLTASPAAAATGTGTTQATAAGAAPMSAAPGASWTDPPVTGAGSPRASEQGWPFLGHGDTSGRPGTPTASPPSTVSPPAGGGTGRPAPTSAEELSAVLGDVLPDDVLIVPLTPVSAADTPSGAAHPPSATAAPDPGGRPAPVRASEQGWPFLGHPDQTPSPSPGAGTGTGPAATGQAGAAGQAGTGSQPETGGRADGPGRAGATGQAGAGDPMVPAAPLGTGTPGTVPGAPAPAPRSSPGGPSEEVVVLRGDSLWSIAARHLGPSATSDQIAAEWPRWWSANADVIGPDPDVILPGQRLVPPPAR
ncbi:LysM peptidoglycan-binding domain-containing protein [Parafrankia sp. FMc2]|uniref:LysM peptidoglycan-binding domain-containing protein n=1 Tax=Parafrankia sp. FMc2 TaxID=3233196 RepID=UPI0034D79040